MEVTDPRAIRALAHPLRMDLLELLGMAGPTTAAQCARALGVPQANCSFHLRQLAKYGFVEDAGPSGDRRERLWRVAQVDLRFLGGDAAVRAVTRELGTVYLQRAMQEMLDHVRRVEDEGSDWRDSGGMLGGIGLLSAAEYAEVAEQCLALLQPYFERAEGGGLQPQAGQRYMRFLFGGAFVKGFDPKESKDESSDD